MLNNFSCYFYYYYFANHAEKKQELHSIYVMAFKSSLRIEGSVENTGNNAFIAGFKHKVLFFGSWNQNMIIHHLFIEYLPNNILGHFL